MGFNRGNYDNVLLYMNFDTLEHSTIENNLTPLIRILNNIFCIVLERLIPFNLRNRRTRQTALFYIPFIHTNYGYNKTMTMTIVKNVWHIFGHF